jgi:2-polyprenyl-6-methoxyphenol hydroxylase-like FAD-dependent oxidoreductase
MEARDEVTTARDDEESPYVLVVGAGPTGLLLASELQRRGVPCRLIDAKDAPMSWDRATVVHPRSLEIFESLGLAEKFLEAGTPQRGAQLHSDGQVLGALDFSSSGSAYAFNVGVSEEVTESILTDYLHDLGGQVIRATRMVGLTQRADGVTVEVEHDGDRAFIDAQWVVGCGGIHSPVREASHIEWEGHDIADQWAVFDTTIDGWNEPYDLTFVYLETTPVILTALPDERWRVYLRPGSPESDLVADASSTVHRYSPGVTFADVENPTRFSCHSKVATRYRSGRALLAGDAAHLCSPTQGHGMNTGLQDAANLAWKLALVYEGAADADLLDSYEAERRPAAAGVAASGDEFERTLTLHDPSERAARDDGLRATLTDANASHQEIVAEVELNVEYPGSPIVSGASDRRLGPGHRLPNTIPLLPPGTAPARLHQLTHRAAHTLVVLGGPAADPNELDELFDALQRFASDSPRFDAAIRIGTGPGRADPFGYLGADAAAALDLDDITVLAVRPDGYIGLRADRDHPEAVAAYDTLIRLGHA